MKIFFVCLYFLPVLVFGQTKSAVFNTFLNSEQVQHANIAFEICNLSTQSIEISYQADKFISPASLQKLVTTSTAIKTLGENFQFKTIINLNGTIENGTFKGVLEIIASGDPSLNTKFVEDVFAFLKEKNISKMEGNIRLDESKYSNLPPQSWLVEDVGNYFGTPAFGFNFMENTYRLNFSQSEQNTNPKIINTVPNMSHLSFDNQVISSGTKDRAYILGMPFSKERKVVGSIPAGKGTFTIKGAMDNPAQIFKNMLLKKFQENNFAFTLNANIASSKSLYTKEIRSSSLKYLVEETNLNSNNLYAEALLNAICIQKYGFASELLASKFLQENFSGKDFIAYDGSGLSRKNRLTASFLINVLKENASTTMFQKSLGISGVSGTMKYFNSEKVKGKIRAKSGSTDGILNYAGYFENAKGEKFAFVFIVNDFSGSSNALRKEMVKVLDSFL